MSRVAAIVLPSLRIEIAKMRASPRAVPFPLAVVIARPRGAVKNETSLLGNTRLDEVSMEARALGIRSGQTIAAARARCADLRVVVVEAGAVTRALESVSEMALAFGASVSFEAGGFLGDVAWVDVTGCGHLHSTKGDPEGECTLAARLAERVRASGHACRVAVADGTRVAAAVARYGDAKDSSPPIVVSPTGNRGAIAKLPLRALPLDDEAVSWLTKLGMRKVSDLQGLPRRALAARLGAQAPNVMALLEGDDRARLLPYVPPQVPEERAELEYGIENSEALLFVCKSLCDRLALRLAGRCTKAARLSLALRLDRGLSLAHVQTHDPILEMRLASPLAKSDELLNVLRAKIDAYEISSPILVVLLRATELVASEGESLHLLEPEAKADRALPRLTTELAAELGEAKVGTLSLCDTWIAEERTSLLPYQRGKKVASAPFGHPLLSGSVEPSRLLPVPVLTSRRALTNVRLLSRSEAVEWWTRGVTRRDVFVGWFEGDRRLGDARGMAWFELDRATGETRVRGWMD
jgi:protein ImuB